MSKYHYFAFGCGYCEDALPGFLLLAHCGGFESVEAALTNITSCLIAYAKQDLGWYRDTLPDHCQKAIDSKDNYCPECGSRLDYLHVQAPSPLDQENEELADLWRGLFKNPLPIGFHDVLIEAGWLYASPGSDSSWVEICGLDSILNYGICDHSISCYCDVEDK